MRPSSVRSRHRRRDTPNRALVLGLLACSAITGCKGDAKPEPKLVEQASPFDRGPKPKPPRDPDDPLRNPAYETPRGRDGEQVSDAQIDATLAEAASFAEVGDVAQQRNVLRKCANKTPPSARCDGQMGLSMIEAKNRRATALYYLSEAAAIDDPKASADLYAQIGDQLRQHGKFVEATVALERAIARGEAPEHVFALGEVLSLTPERLAEGADHMAAARAKDDRLEWLHDEAVIRAQIPVREQAQAALGLFATYVERTAKLPPDELPSPPDRVKARMAELELLVKQYPTAKPAANPKPQTPPS